MKRKSKHNYYYNKHKIIFLKKDLNLQVKVYLLLKTLDNNKQVEQKLMKQKYVI